MIDATSLPVILIHMKGDEVTGDGVNIRAKMTKQIRAIKKYAHALGILDLDIAAMRWVQTGCATRWAEFQ